MEPEPNSTRESTPAPAPPVAKVVAERRWSWAWLAPLAAAAFVAYLTYQSWEPAGPSVLIHFAEGHGLKPGDVLRHRGVVIGEVRDVKIADDLAGVDVSVDLKHEAATIARNGSRFWIVRPRIEFGTVEGLDTIVGPRYLAVMPGDGPPSKEFHGNEDPPLDERIEPGGLEIVLQAAERGGLQAGAGVYYRQFRVGTILDVALAADGSVVESRAYIRPPYRALLHERTRFWNIGSVDLDAGWFRGVTLEVATLEELVRGGVAFATPDDSGSEVVDGHRFTLAPRAEEEWRNWSPSLRVAGIAQNSEPPPSPQRAILTWKHDGTFRNPERRREGYVLRVDQGFLGLADLLTLPEDAFAGSVHVAINGKKFPVTVESMRMFAGLAILPHAFNEEEKPAAWPAERIRNPGPPEDCLVFTNATGEPQTIAAARCVESETGWRIDAAVPFDGDWHGAPVIAVRDANLLGFLAWREDHAEVVLLKNVKKSEE